MRRFSKHFVSIRSWLCTAFAVLCWPASIAHAGLNGYGVFYPDNSAGGPALDGFVTNDLRLNFTGQLTGVQMVLDLTSGSVFQSIVGTDTPPNPAFFSVLPELEFDTFVGLGAFESSSTDATPGFAGAAVDIGLFSRPLQFDTAGIDVAIFPPGGVVIDSGNLYPVARITLSDDANGTFRFLASAGGDISPVIELPVFDGVIFPEPATAWALCLGAMVLGGFRGTRFT